MEVDVGKQVLLQPSHALAECDDLLWGHLREKCQQNGAMMTSAQSMEGERARMHDSGQEWEESQATDGVLVGLRSSGKKLAAAVAGCKGVETYRSLIRRDDYMKLNLSLRITLACL